MKRSIFTLVLLASTLTHAANEKTFLVDGQKATPKQAIQAGMAGKKVQRCSTLDSEIVVDGKVIKGAQKCQDVSLYVSKSGMPTWKASNTGEKW